MSPPDDDKRRRQAHADDCLHTRIAVLEERVRGQIELREQDAKERERQATEYARRLQELNHAHDQAVERNATFISREIFEAAFNQWDIWRRGVDKEMSEVRGKATGYAAYTAVLLALAALGITTLKDWPW